MDLAQLVMTVSSQLPTVEESSPTDEAPSLPASNPERLSSGTAKQRDDVGKIAKITWWRPHGLTAIAPGLKKITLKVRMDSPSKRDVFGGPQTTGQLFQPNGMPDLVIMQHLLDVFMTHFGCQFPFLDRHRLDHELESGTGSVFLFNCIAATAAR